MSCKAPVKRMCYGGGLCLPEYCWGCKDCFCYIKGICKNNHCHKIIKEKEICEKKYY